MVWRRSATVGAASRPPPEIAAYNLREGLNSVVRDMSGKADSLTSGRYCGLRDDWFRELTDKNIRRGSFPSVPDLIASIEDYLRVTNANPKPLIWTASAESHPREGPPRKSRPGPAIRTPY